MTDSTTELREALAQTEATIRQVVRCAGQGASPDVERRLDQHARVLRGLLDAADGDAARETIAAAKRALEAADPAAPLLMLAIAQKQLGLRVRRRLSRNTQDRSPA